MKLTNLLIRCSAMALLLWPGWGHANAESVKGEEAPGKPVVIDVSNYRIGASNDGNHHDSDDLLDVALEIALCVEVGVKDKLTHLDSSNHLGSSKPWRVEQMQAMPTVWDETIVLPGSTIGGLAAFARRSGQQWVVGILNGGAARDYELALKFLPPGAITANLVQDDLAAAPVAVASIGINKKADLKQWTTTVPFKVTTAATNRSQKLTVHLATGGGFIARFTR